MLTRQTEKEWGKKLTGFASPMRRWDSGWRTWTGLWWTCTPRYGSTWAFFPGLAPLQAGQQNKYDSLVRGGHLHQARVALLRSHIPQGKEGAWGKAYLNLMPWETFSRALNQPGIQSLSDPLENRKLKTSHCCVCLRGKWLLKICGKRWDVNTRAVPMADWILSEGPAIVSRRRQTEYASDGFQNMLFTIRSRCSLSSNVKIQAFYFLLTD